MSRDEHLEWAKKRALEYLDAGDTSNAFTSMLSDLRKHPELEKHPGCEIGVHVYVVAGMDQQHARAATMDCRVQLMPFPATKAEMLEEGYTFAAMKTCPCGEAMELWNTPRGALMPMNPMETMESAAVVHWATCPKAEQFRRKPKSQ